MSFIRSLLYAIWFYSSLGLIGIPCMPAAFLSRKAAVWSIQFWAATQRGALRLFCGIRTEFRGLENLPAGACIIAMKHQSTYDTIAPFLFLKDPAFILKQELLKAPVFGLYASQSRMIPIDRGGGVKTVKKMMAAAAAELKAGRPIVIFPEGTRQDVDAPTDLKSGVAAMYLAQGVPCVPVALNTGLVWRGSAFKRRPGRAIFQVLPAIEPGLKRDAFMQRLQDALDPATKILVAEGRIAQGRNTAAPTLNPGEIKKGG
jgi:1-acyl-sn-glycerol-3-phosphate acyltransferase